MEPSTKKLTVLTVILFLLVIAGFIAWDLVQNSLGKQSITLAAKGKEVRAIHLMSAPASTAERSPRLSLVPDPEEESTHVIYPVYFGTDRLPGAPFRGLDFWNSLWLFVAWCLALASVFSRLLGRCNAIKKFATIISLAFLVASIASGCFAIRDYFIAKASPTAAQAFLDGRGQLSYGVCTVSIPYAHERGSLEAPSVLSFEFREDAAKHIILQRVQPLSLEDFGKEIGGQAETSAWHEALVFVHGYNVSFEDAARRTAQLAYDLRFGGVAAFFSWPANGHTAAYTWDEESSEYAVPHLREFLETLARNGNVKRIHVIAHSMGNRCLLAALSSSKSVLNSGRLGQCVFAAPDVDRVAFDRDIKQLTSGWSPQPDGFGRLTLYASSKDHALASSQAVHRYPRAGSGGSDILLADGLESIDASNLETDYLGHSYFSTNTHLINDLSQMIEDHLSATERKGMLERPVGHRRYWEFRPVQP